MLKRNSLLTRIVIGKLTGLAVGLVWALCLVFLVPESSAMLLWGVLFWGLTIGLVIGLIGVVTWHPVLSLPMPWWIRGPVMGAWMNFVLVLIAYGQVEALTATIAGSGAISPFWLVLEGAVAGLLIGFLVTHFGGEGKDIVDTTAPADADSGS